MAFHRPGKARSLIDLKVIRDQTDMVRSALQSLYVTAPIDEILALDESRRQVVTEVETLKAKRNEGSRKRLDGPGIPSGAPRLIEGDAHPGRRHRG
ncbi:MAG: hypothetical protein R2848_08095 [Thermomicrobiales bacterium]